MKTQERRLGSVEILTIELEVVAKTTTLLQRLFRDYFGGGGEIMASAQEIDRLEDESDRLQRRLEKMLLEQENLNRWDMDFLHMADAIDKIANRVEDAADFVVLTLPQVPNFLIEPIERMAEVTILAFESLHEGWRCFRTNPAKVVESTHRIGDHEEAVDQLLWDATRALFDSDLGLAEKIHVKNLLDIVETITNRIEDVGHALEILAIRESNRESTTPSA